MGLYDGRYRKGWALAKVAILAHFVLAVIIPMVAPPTPPVPDAYHLCLFSPRRDLEITSISISPLYGARRSSYIEPNSANPGENVNQMFSRTIFLANRADTQGSKEPLFPQSL
jgi:hypothetical protein